MGELGYRFYKNEARLFLRGELGYLFDKNGSSLVFAGEFEYLFDKNGSSLFLRGNLDTCSITSEARCFCGGTWILVR